MPLFFSQFWLLVMKAPHPERDDGKFLYFVDKYLLFGSSISCALFQKVSDALKWITECRIRKKKRITNYLDDFLFLAACASVCNAQAQTFLQVCVEINCPVAEDKTEWATDKIIFLGALLDGSQLIVIIPEEKRRKRLLNLRITTLLIQLMGFAQIILMVRMA